MKIGIFGAGQLGRMLALSGYPLGHQFVFLDSSSESCAAPVGELIVADYADAEALDAFSKRVDVATLEFENVPVAALQHVLGRRPCYPGAKALATAQDRLNEKQLFSKLGIAVPSFAAIDTLADLTTALAEFGYPAVLKTRRFGYDGKGQAVLRDASDVARHWPEMKGKPLILEAFVPFDYEVSCLAVRAIEGSIVFYTLVQNFHRDGVLRLSRPLLNAGLQIEAEAATRRVMIELDYVGVMAFEFFVSGGRLLANEIAPRVHNSGHWTIEGASCSQFENHLRAVTGAALGSTRLRGASLMYNFVGCEPPDAALSVPDVHVHHYGKTAQAGRKLAHLTVVADSAETLHQRIRALEALDGWPQDLRASDLPTPITTI